MLSAFLLVMVELYSVKHIPKGLVTTRKWKKKIFMRLLDFLYRGGRYFVTFPNETFQCLSTDGLQLPVEILLSLLSTYIDNHLKVFINPQWYMWGVNIVDINETVVIWFIPQTNGDILQHVYWTRTLWNDGKDTWYTLNAIHYKLQ